ncbi:signal transduction histidine kinase [Desulfohalotomaculum tongense]|uniref:sensor histidine kinase n=1 Tax=Desulforadius tongensis TaxID=1216062 RepID=UPI0019589697|nr:ATP-binding protein [Desulforadius tongensis]MBM7853927.1 signal transduction histidine kinase [Desulforadius tongensis]
MRWNSIVTKLWAAITVLVLLVIGIAGAAQTSFMENIYYQQQSEQLISIGNKAAKLARTEIDAQVLDMKVAVISEMIDGNVMIIDKNNTVLSCQGLGISTKDMIMDLHNPHHGPLTQDDLNRLFNGETIVHKGRSEYFQTDVLSVGIPVDDPKSAAGAVIIHAPLKPLAGQFATFKIIIIYTAVSGIVLATILSLLFSKMVSRPLLDMSRVSLAMASGDFSRQVTVNSNDEVGLLASSLNTLSTRLQEKLAQLERLDQMRREFVANVSHEIKTPLTIMQAFTEALEDDIVTGDRERKEYLKNINEEIHRLRRLVNDVLDLKKMEEGHGDFEKEYVDLNSVVSSVENKFRALKEKARVNLEFNIDRSTPQVFCSKDRIEQVFINLIDNAIRHTPEGGKVSVNISPKADSVMIEVKDTGTGIAGEDLPMIWERFYKADKSRTRGQGGTGLGLAIVKRIIEAHGGCINVQSRPGAGTTFTIILPTKKTAAKSKK